MPDRSPSNGALSATDPLRTLWDRLEAAGCGPHGEAWNFRSTCPGHNGDGVDSLSAAPGADGRALLHCFVGCDTGRIVAALGLEMSSLFPSGHRRARRLAVHPARRPDFTGAARDVADMVYAVDRLKEDWRAELILQCPGCGSGSALFVASSRHPSFMSCPSGCTVEQVAQTLAGQLQDRRAA
jgi:hypothetical protein